MFKFVVLCAALATARAGYLSSAAPSISYSSYAAAPALRYAASAPALGYAAAAPVLSYDTGYTRAVHAAPAIGYAAPALGYAAPAVGYAAATPALGLHSTTSVSYSRAIHPSPAVGYTSFAAPAIHAAPLAATAVVQPTILRSFGSLAGYAAPAVHASSFGYAAAAPLAYKRIEHSGIGCADCPGGPSTLRHDVLPNYHGNSLGYAAAPVDIGYRSYAPATPLVARAGYAGGHGLEYAAAAPAIW